MTAHIMCLTSSGGLPLFTRKLGEGDALPFSVVASLNGVHMFGKCHNVLLQNTITTDMTVVWREVEDSVVLIAAAKGASEPNLQQLITSVYKAMIFVVGIDEIKSPRSVERLKRDLRACYPIIDKLLCGLEGGTDFLGMHEVFLCSENHLLQGVLDSFCDCVGSLYGVLLVRGSVAVATAAWWALDPIERQLLVLLLCTGGEHCIGRDVPVFLPVKSPQVAFRAVSCVLTSGTEICLICGPTPTLAEVERTAIQCWRGAIDLLRGVQQNFSLDAGVIGVLLVDTEVGKFMLSRNSKRVDMLRTFYQHITYRGVPNTLESYWCSEYHKCYSIRNGNNLICVMYTSAVPTVTMRLLTKQTLKLLTSDRQLCW